MPNTLPLTPIVDVTIQTSPMIVPRPTFNQMLIVGSSTHIPSVGASSRIRQYATMAEMVADGFLTTDHEYIAANLYFSQSPAPDYVWIGRQDLTAIHTLIPNSGNEGSDYVEGDIITVVQAGGSYGTATVTEVGAGGAVVTLAAVLGVSGTGYSEASALSTTGGTGTGLKVDITAVGETIAQAIAVCRLVNYEWYVAYAVDAAANDHKECASWAETATPTSIYAFDTDDADVLAGTASNIFDYLQNLSYSRTIGQYASTQDDEYPNNAYAMAAIMGYAMGQNTGLANSAYTLKFKAEVGIATEPLTTSQVNTIESFNGNLYLSRGNSYSVFEQGKMSNGQFFDEILNLDMLSNDIQLNVMDLLYSVPKVPQTDAGMTQIIHVLNLACEAAVSRGFLGPSIWTGQPVLNLNLGDALPKGYLVQCSPVSSQSTADRQARKSMPMYVAICESGAVHSITIGVYVQR